jgi:ferredoxin
MRIALDMRKCCGNGMCAVVAPKFFKLTDTGQLKILQSTFGKEDLDLIKEAELCCPAGAISYDDGKAAG